MTQNESKVMLVTGGSEGLGAACVKVFHQAGWKISVLSLPGPKFESRSSPELLTVAGDVGSDEVRRFAVAQTISHFGRIDLLINNAGVGLYAPPSSADLGLSRRLFETNVFGPLAMAQLVIPIMLRQKAGTIVNIGSVGGLVSLPWSVMYSASKYALHAVDDSLYRELRPKGIRVIKVCAGIIDTAFREHVLAGKAPAEVSSIKRVVSPGQVAARIYQAVESGARTVYVPRIGRLFTAMGMVTQWLMDWYLARKWKEAE